MVLSRFTVYVADTLSLLLVRMERVHHSLDGRLPRITLQFSSGKIVQDAVPKRTVGNLHNINLEFFENRDQNRNAAREHLSAVLFQPVELDLVDAFGMDNFVLELFKRIKSDRAVGNPERSQNGRNGTDGTRRPNASCQFPLTNLYSLPSRTEAADKMARSMLCAVILRSLKKVTEVLTQPRGRTHLRSSRGRVRSRTRSRHLRYPRSVGFRPRAEAQSCSLGIQVSLLLCLEGFQPYSQESFLRAQ